MKTLFLVTRIRGQAWDASQPLNAQAEWPEHATFMNRLVADGFVLLGGLVAETEEALLVVDAAGEDEIEATLARDPWSQSGLLELKSIQRWTVLLHPEEA